MKSFKILAFTAFFITALAVLSSSTYRIISQSEDKDIAPSSEEIQILDASIYDIGRQIPIASTEPSLLETNQLQKAAKDKLKLYPSPVNDRLYIDINTPHLEAYEARVIDILGRIYLSRYINPTSYSYTVSFPVMSLEPGVYFVCLRSTSGTMMTGKFIKE